MKKALLKCRRRGAAGYRRLKDILEKRIEKIKGIDDFEKVKEMYESLDYVFGVDVRVDEFWIKDFDRARDFVEYDGFKFCGKKFERNYKDNEFFRKFILFLNEYMMKIDSIGGHDKAKEILKQIMIFLKKFGDDSKDLVILTINNSSILYKRSDQPKKSIDCLLQAFSIMKAYPISQCMPYFSESEEAKKAVVIGKPYIKTCINLTAIYNFQSDHEQASKLAKLAIEACKIDLKNLHDEEGSVKSADPLITLKSKLRDEVTDLLILAYFNLGSEYEHLKLFKKCLGPFKNCLCLIKKRNTRDPTHQKIKRILSLAIAKYEKYLLWFKKDASFSNLSHSRGSFSKSNSKDGVLISSKTQNKFFVSAKKSSVKRMNKVAFISNSKLSIDSKFEIPKTSACKIKKTKLLMPKYTKSPKFEEPKTRFATLNCKGSQISRTMEKRTCTPQKKACLKLRKSQLGNWKKRISLQKGNSKVLKWKDKPRSAVKRGNPAIALKKLLESTTFVVN
ncbi:unnamed protein product [Moneuplotes crassus]|uniref:Uncharacterized protein n=1 Tax=Euplotes crassus TaxID=5936 RepID=A0AAD1X4M8_EUPCR|nr:unnamed protein product [Moneuplotes crassus]